MTNLRWLKRKTDFGNFILQQYVDGEWVDVECADEEIVEVKIPKKEEPKKKLLWERLMVIYTHSAGFVVKNEDMCQIQAREAIRAVEEVYDEWRNQVSSCTFIDYLKRELLDERP